MNFNQIKKCKNCLMDSTASNFKIETINAIFAINFLMKKILKSGDLAKLIKEIKKNGKNMIVLLVYLEELIVHIL